MKLSILNQPPSTESPDNLAFCRELPYGVTRLLDGRLACKVWAPRCQALDWILFPQAAAEMFVPLTHRADWRAVAQSAQPRVIPLTPLDAPERRRAVEAGDYAAIIAAAETHPYYFFRLNGQDLRPDPRSAFQPFGVHGPSQWIDHGAFPWTDQAWVGLPAARMVIYELHVGCFSSEGTYRACREQLPRLRELGVTAIELLPLADTPGRWNWGYDGVHLFAPKAAYGSVDELKMLIDECHRQGIAVLLDVVYNHLGPEGNYLREFAPYFSSSIKTPWGEALNYSGRQRQQVRQWILDNVRHWLTHYHFDGLRLDAIHYLFDTREPSLTQEIAETVQRVATEMGRTCHCIAETNVFDPQLPSTYTAQWADCFMHAVYSLGAPNVRLTNRPYRGAEDVAAALRQGFVYSGSAARDYQRHEPPLPGDDRPAAASHAGLVVPLQTHDSVGNHPHGKRLHHLTSADFQRAAAALMLLAPSIPQLFMGEEGSVASPFCFFADFGDPSLRAAVDRGRQHEYPHHAWDDAPLPSDPAAFFSSCLPDRATWDSVTGAWYQWLLQLRRAGLEAGWLCPDNAIWSHAAGDPYFVLEYRGQDFLCRVESWLWPPDATVPAVPAGLYGGVTSSGGVVRQTWPCDTVGEWPFPRARVTQWSGAVALEPLSARIP